ncbi:MAG: winged helix-turn-helix domain-containing protein [Promethearchaeota archaeon]
MSKEPKIEDLKSKIRFGIKFWLEFENKSILGSGWANLLYHIEKNETGSLTQAAKECNYSYKYAWNILKRIEKRTGKPVVLTGKGGRGGGGWVKLNEWGQHLLEVYKNYLKEIKKIEKKLGETMNIS